MNASDNTGQENMKRKESVLKNIVLIVALMIVFGFAVFIYSSFFITPEYESNITIYVTERENGEEEEKKTLSPDTVASQQLVPTCIEMIKSNNVLDEVKDVVRKKHIDKEITLSKLKEMVTVEAIPNTEIVRVAVRTTDMIKSREIANIIADVAPDKIQKFIERSDVKIIDKARISHTPVSPNIRNNIVNGALSGLCLGTAFVIFKWLLKLLTKSADRNVKKTQTMQNSLVKDRK